MVVDVMTYVCGCHDNFMTYVRDVVKYDVVMDVMKTCKSLFKSLSQNLSLGGSKIVLGCMWSGG